jgi:hypothetical protein
VFRLSSLLLDQAAACPPILSTFLVFYKQENRFVTRRKQVPALEHSCGSREFTVFRRQSSCFHWEHRTPVFDGGFSVSLPLNYNTGVLRLVQRE